MLVILWLFRMSLFDVVKFGFRKLVMKLSKLDLLLLFLFIIVSIVLGVIEVVILRSVVVFSLRFIWFSKRFCCELEEVLVMLVGS